MSDPSPAGGVATSSSGLSDLTLSVRIEGVPEQEVFLQHGLSMGRNPSNTICIDEPNIERIHAMVRKQPDGSMLLECTDDHLRLSLADGTSVHNVPLKPGTTIKLGKATIRCLKRETKPTVLVSDNPWEIRCPRCHETLTGKSKDLKACPACSVDLMYFQQHGADGIHMPGEFEGWLPGTVGPYKIRAFVAQGGMGIILRGLHSQNDLPAAVKLLKVIDDGDPTWEARFLAEIDTLKGLKHPNVVRLQDHGKDGKLLWLAMDWIDGQSLTKMQSKFREQHQPFPIDQIREILTQVVQGLKYLHEKSIIHRDLKPSNILMAQDALVKMVDFGIARAASGQTSVMTQLTHTGMVAGTESYMSPEQAEGQVLTPASDIYSIGVIWYELLVGRRPIGAFASPSLTRPDCPPAWSNLIAQCLGVQPYSRPSLDAILHGLSGTGAPPPITGVRPGPFVPPPPPGGGMTGITGIRPANVPPAPPQHTGMTPAWNAAVPQTQIGPNLPPVQNQVPPQQQQYFVPNQGPAQPAGPSALEKTWETTKTTSKQVGSFLATNVPPLLRKLGPVGQWIQTHRGPSIGIGAALFLIILILMIRSCGSPDTPANTNTGGGGGGAAPVQGAGGNAANPLAKGPDQLYAEGLAGIAEGVANNDIPTFRRGLESITQAADKGHVRAMVQAGTIYVNPPSPVFQDRQKGIKYLEMAAAKGDPEARLILRQVRGF